MKGKFLNLYNSVTNRNEIVLEDYFSLFNTVIYEGILNCPIKLHKTVKDIVMKLINDDDFESVVKVGVFEAINDNYCKELDNEIYSELVELFKDNKECFFTVRISNDEECFTKEAGIFRFPKYFRRFDNCFEESHLMIPKMTVWKTDNILIQNYVKQINKLSSELKSDYSLKQRQLEAFKKSVFSSDDKSFGEIVIFPKNLTVDSNNVDSISLDEAIKHECQHLCIFLMSLAKTCIYFGLHFSNSSILSSTQYVLKEEEFITLFSSYISILKRIYEKIDDPKNANEFIHELLNLCIYNKCDNNKYSNKIKMSRMFNSIKNFYKKIYEDSSFSKYDAVYSNGKFTKVKAASFIGKNKFSTLIKWTLKSFEGVH